MALAVLARGSTTRGTIDLRSKFGAWLTFLVGRTGTTALTNGVDVRVYRTLNNDGSLQGGAYYAYRTGLTAANETTIASDSSSGAPTLNLTSGTGFAADQIVTVAASSDNVTRFEIAHTSKISGGTLTIDQNLKTSHTAAQADKVRNQAEQPPALWLDGGATYAVVFDYGDDSAGESVVVQALAQTLDTIA